MGLDSESGEASCEEAGSPDRGNNVKHKKSSHLLNDVNDLNKRKVHKCPHDGCKSAFSRPWRLDAHMCVHSGNRPYRCKYLDCTKSYTNASHLKRHVNGVHKTLGYTPMFMCSSPGCMLQFKSKCNLTRHFNRNHNVKHVCQVCKKEFVKQKLLKVHLIQHNINKATFRCEVCDVGFLDKRSLNRHNRGHKSYTCLNADCNLVFRIWTDLRRHMKLVHPSTHTCSDCGKIYHNKSFLRQHALCHLVDNCREVFNCPHENCPRYYFQKSNLGQHISCAHNGIKHKCPHPGCSRELCTKQKLNEHIKLHKPNRSLPQHRMKQSKRRKDVGKHKRCMAAKLSGIVVPHSLDKTLLSENINNEGNNTNQLENKQLKDLPGSTQCSNTDEDDRIVVMLTDSMQNVHRTRDLDNVEQTIVLPSAVRHAVGASLI